MPTLTRVPADTLEVIMVHQISGERYVDTGKKDQFGAVVHEHNPWPKPGDRIRLPRAEALSLIHNELAYPAKGGIPPRPSPIEDAIESQDLMAAG